MTGYALGSGVQGSPGRVGRMRMSNRARTQAEMSARFLASVPEADRGASNTPVYTSNFSAGVDGWTASNFEFSTAAGNQDGIGGVDDTLKIEIASSGSTDRGGNRSTTFTAGKLYRMSFDIYMPSTNVNQTQMRASRLGNVLISPVIDTWTQVVIEGTATSTALIFRFNATTKTVGDKAYFKNFVINQIGLTADYSPSAIQLAPGQWHDEANKKHFHVPDGFRLGNPATDGKIYGKKTWAAADTLQYVTGVNAPVLPLNTVMTLYAKADVSGTFDLGDGVDQDRFGVGVTIGTTWAPVTLALPAHDGTNRDLTIKPTSSYSGTVDTCWMVEVVQ